MLERLARASEGKPMQFTSAITLIPTPAASVIESQTTPRTAPTITRPTVAPSTSDELLGKWRGMDELNARLAHPVSKLFAKAVEPFLQVHRWTAKQGLCPELGALMSVRSAAQTSPGCTRMNTSGSS